MEKIRTHYVFPPIPLRQFDWCAVRDSYEPGWPIGYGRTEAEAIADLHETECPGRVDALRDAASALHYANESRPGFMCEGYLGKAEVALSEAGLPDLVARVQAIPPIGGDMVDLDRLENEVWALLKEARGC